MHHASTTMRRSSYSTGSGSSQSPTSAEIPLGTPLVPLVPIPDIGSGILEFDPQHIKDFTASDSGVARKRKPHTRTKTGCRRCRQQRVKCPEGPNATSGRKIICRRCWETDRPCYYPAKNTQGKVARNSDEAWERAEDVDEWRWASGATEYTEVVDTTSATPRQGAGAQTSGPSLGSFDSALVDTATPRDAFDWAALFPPTPHSGAQPASILLLDEEDREQHNQHGLLSLVSNTFSPSSARTALPDAPATASWTPGFLGNLLSPSPLHGVVNPITLANLSTSSTDRLIVNYFEQEGCNEIVSCAKSKHNWIFMELFPRLLATLAVQPASPSSAPDDIDGAIRQWLHFCLLQIAYVHRANIEPDEPKSWHFRSEAARYRQKASYAILRAKVKWPEGQWKTEQYLMGFFVRCMADMLDSGNLLLDRTTVFELPREASTPFYGSLRDMIGLYSTLQYACTSIDLQVGSVAPLFEMPRAGDEWVERFVGFSRRIVRIIGRVNGMVVYRAGLIRAGTDSGGPGKLLRAEAERLASELGECWDWDENAQEVGQSSRVQRGDEVMRHALLVLLLCEVLHAPLDDPRILSATDRSIELVADCEPATVGGFQWALTILAIYTADPEVRERLQSLISQSLSLSFGRGYRGPDDILQLCWEAHDRNGGYENGVAPWRDAMSALGRNLFI